MDWKYDRSLKAWLSITPEITAIVTRESAWSFSAVITKTGHYMEDEVILAPKTFVHQNHAKRWCKMKARP